ncbi:MAG: hypothetical protein H7829_17280 [Magnetococcus sp. THC-1_WYH]
MTLSTLAGQMVPEEPRGIRDFEFDTIDVNGSNNLPNLKLDDANWKVCLIEEEFMKRMWNTGGTS